MFEYKCGNLPGPRRSTEAAPHTGPTLVDGSFWSPANRPYINDSCERFPRKQSRLCLQPTLAKREKAAEMPSYTHKVIVSKLLEHLDVMHK
jgi:hypothetical protein